MRDQRELCQLWWKLHQASAHYRPQYAGTSVVSNTKCFKSTHILLTFDFGFER